MIIDVTDFNDREYKVPNQEESRDFASFIGKVENELATGQGQNKISLLGVDLWNDFKEAVDGSGSLPTFFASLLNGADYVFDGKTYHYGGWVDLVRPGIYSEWLPVGTSKFTNIGFVSNNAPQQSKLIDDQYPFQVEYWNKFASKVGFTGGCGYNYVNSFYGFMKANEEDNEAIFDLWVFNTPTFKNRHDF